MDEFEEKMESLTVNGKRMSEKGRYSVRSFPF